MRMLRFAKVLVGFLVGVMLVQLLHACSPSQAAEKTRLTIATVNNVDATVAAYKATVTLPAKC